MRNNFTYNLMSLIMRRLILASFEIKEPKIDRACMLSKLYLNLYRAIEYDLFGQQRGLRFHHLLPAK